MYTSAKTCLAISLLDGITNTSSFAHSKPYDTLHGELSTQKCVHRHGALQIACICKSIKTLH